MRAHRKRSCLSLELHRRLAGGRCQRQAANALARKTGYFNLWPPQAIDVVCAPAIRLHSRTEEPAANGDRPDALSRRGSDVRIIRSPRACSCRCKPRNLPSSRHGPMVRVGRVSRGASALNWRAGRNRCVRHGRGKHLIDRIGKGRHLTERSGLDFPIGVTPSTRTGDAAGNLALMVQLGRDRDSSRAFESAAVGLAIL